MNRFAGLLALAGCLVLASCGDEPGDDAARAACEAYGRAPSGVEDAATLRTTAQEHAQRAAEADDTYAALLRDLDDALSRAQAMAAAHNAGRALSGGQVDAYFAADEQVRADCAAAGNDIGPLRP